MQCRTGAALAISNDELSQHFWDPSIYPAWFDFNILRLVVRTQEAWGPEPHFHDIAEYWLFPAGVGEARVGSWTGQITPNTVVYTPPGVFHSFHMYCGGCVVSGITRLRTGDRAGHLWTFDPDAGRLAPTLPDPHTLATEVVSDEIDPTNTADAFVITGDQNTQDAWQPTAGILTELRCFAGDELRSLATPWQARAPQALIVAGGVASVEYDSVRVGLCAGDQVVVQRGTELRVSAPPEAVVIRASQR